MNRLLILDSDAATYRREVEAYRLPDLDIFTAFNVDEANAYASGVEIMFGKPALIAQILHRAKRLRWVQSTFAGIEPLCSPGLPTDYTLTGVKDVFGSLMREYVFGHILARERSIIATHQNQLEKNWRPIGYRSLADITIGVAGLGSIGMRIAETACHFGMRVLGMKRTAGDVSCVDQLYTVHEMNAFLPQLDYLVLVLPDTADSRNFIAAAQLEMMKATAVLINVGRGVTVHEHDLIEALASGRIGGAILDVFAEEPLAPESPLWGMENVVVTPHNSAYSFPEQITSIFAENYKRYIDNKALNYQVNFTRGY